MDANERIRDQIRQLRKYVIRPTLHRLAHYTYSAELLMAGTAAHESDGLRSRSQYGRGPARGIYQIEENTYNDLWRQLHRERWRSLAERIKQLIPYNYRKDPAQAYSQIITNDAYATAIARFRYMTDKEPIPHVTAPVKPDEIKLLARYWGRHYQRMSDPDKIQKFIDDFKLWVWNTN